MQVRQLQRHGGRQLNQNDDGEREIERVGVGKTRRIRETVRILIAIVYNPKEI